MAKKDEKVTLIARAAEAAARAWDDSIGGTALVFVDSPSFLPAAIELAMRVHQQQVARVIIDRVVTPIQFLQVITSLPHDFLGDVLFIRSDGESFLSANGRGGDRILYALDADDVRFYLRTMQLIGEEVTEAAVRRSKA